MACIFSVAYGDGIAQENLSPTDIKGKKVSLFIKMDPPIITSEKLQNRYLMLRWYDANTNQTLTHTTFFLGLMKNGKTLVGGLLHTHNGILTVRIMPSNDPTKWTIRGQGQPFEGSTMHLPQENGTIDFVAPMLGEGGLYHIRLALLTLDNDENLLNVNKAPPVFDSYLSVGDVVNHTITYHNNSYNTTLISYYDKTSNFTFDQSKKQFAWTMPFDWNAARFQNVPIFVHEELRIPKAFQEFASAPTFAASVNGNPIISRKVVADPYSMSDTEILHIIISKNDIENLTKSTPLQADTMNFTVEPMTSDINTSSSVLTDFGGWEIKLEWNPTNISADSQNDLQLTFFDASTGQKVRGDVNYDLKILGKDDNTEFSRTGIDARNGTDTQLINLPSNGIYSLEIKVNSIANGNLSDTSRIGLARGTLAIPSIASDEATIPEFASLAEVVIIIALLVSIVISKKLFQVQHIYPK